MALSVQIEKRLGSFQLKAAFTAEPGEILALLGPSGCGKSMTLKCIAGIEKPDQGRIELDGRVLFDKAAGIDLPPQARGVGYLFQQYALFPNMTVAQNIQAGVRRQEKALRQAALQELLALLRLEGLENRRPAQLSGGQQQRVALARILASQPAAILLDEPFAALDSFLKWQLEQEIARVLAAFGGPCIWVSHDRDEVYRNCGRMCMMEAGKTQPPREKHQLFQDPRTLSAARLTGCKNFVQAQPQEEGNLYLPPWDMVLHVNRPIPPDTAQVGLGDGCLSLAPGAETDELPCQVVNAVEDVSTMILLLRPEGSQGDAPLLRMEIPKSEWCAQERCVVYISSHQAFLLA